MSSSPTEEGRGQIALVTMPQMGVSVVEGTLAAWHKGVGDWVLADETICEIATDKIDTDIPSPADGRVIELAVGAGETVVVGTVLARIAVGRPEIGAHLGDSDRSAAGGGIAAPTGVAPASGGASGGRAGANHSPVVLRMAELHGIDLTQVGGTGRNGRISKQDIEAYLADRPAVGPGVVGGPGSVGPRGVGSRGAGPRDAASGVGSGGVGSGGVGSGGAGSGGVGIGAGERATVSEPLSRMRRAIAEHMRRSLGTAAHCTTVIEVDMSAIVRARRAAGLGLLPYVARCVAESLCVFGGMNATLEGDVVTRHGSVNLGIAVSLGEDGLIVPVIERAEKLGVAELAERILDLGARARRNELKVDEVRGGTFTITNPGRWGTTGGTPIINQPQVGILDLEAVVDRVVVLDGQSIGIRPMANLCLSFDHRAMDGNLAAEFLGDVRSRIEGWQEPAG